MKRFRKYVGLVMALVMVMLVMSPMAQANSIIGEMTTEQMLLPSPNAIYSAYGVNIPGALCEELQEINVQVNNGTLVEVLPFEDNMEATALVVTNKNGDTVVKDFIATVDEEYGFLPTLVVEENTVSPQAGFTDYIGPYDLIRATAAYELVYKSEDDRLFGLVEGVRPLSMLFICYPDEDYSISYAAVSFDTYGFVRDLTTFEDISDDNFDIHPISQTAANPVRGRIYNMSDPIASNRYMYISSGALDVGMYFTFIVTVNGSTDDGTVRFTW